MGNLQDLIFRILRSLMRKAYPEITILSRNLDWGFIESSHFDVTFGRHTLVYPPFHIKQTIIGDYSYISLNSYISQTSIGKFCSIGPNLVCGWGVHPINGISTAPMFYSLLKQNGVTLSGANKIEERKPITIGNDVFIGANVTILDGVTIGDGAVIGAGAVVSKDIPSYAVAVGCPIQIVKYRFNSEQVEALHKIKWWDFDDDKLKDVERLFFEVDRFINLESS